MAWDLPGYTLDAMSVVESQQPPAEEIPPYRPHQGPHRQYIRDIVLGVNDGLVSIFLLVAGVVAAGFAADDVVVAAVAAAIAGAISMAAGEYIATKSQDEVFQGEMELEREHLRYHRERELDELREMFSDMGLDHDDVERVVSSLDQDEESLMKVMMALEFGFLETERRRPAMAMLASGGLFLAGSLPPTLPFVFLDSPDVGLAVSAVLSGLSLILVGIAKTFATRGNPWFAGAENLAIGVAGGAAAYAIGSFF